MRAVLGEVCEGSIPVLLRTFAGVLAKWLPLRYAVAAAGCEMGVDWAFWEGAYYPYG